MAYVLNHTNTNLHVGSFAEIKPGKYLLVDKFILESQELAYAVRAKWASIHEKIPAEIAFVKEMIFEDSGLTGTSDYPSAVPAATPAVAPEVAPVAAPEPVVEAPAPAAVVEVPEVAAEPEVVEDTPAEKATKGKASKAASAE